MPKNSAFLVEERLGRVKLQERIEEVIWNRKKYSEDMNLLKK